VIAPRAKTGDAVVVHPLGAPALGYYLSRADSAVTEPRYGPPILDDPDASLDPRRRVWLVFFENARPDADRLPPPEELVGDRRALIDEWSVHRVALMLYGPERA
jgi:hypothetical protein